MVAISSDTLKDPSKGYRGKIQQDVDHAVLLVGRGDLGEVSPDLCFKGRALTIDG
jgi:hypothetical protein